MCINLSFYHKIFHEVPLKHFYFILIGLQEGELMNLSLVKLGRGMETRNKGTTRCKDDKHLCIIQENPTVRLVKFFVSLVHFRLVFFIGEF